ncbi:MAG: Sensor histidine kinase RcsC [Syntrophus sp. SKADARSKE-3]|nr:Sensor histidine kinase RcsC [Syntrophus sp. SKADARSKE-3]
MQKYHKYVAILVVITVCCIIAFLMIYSAVKKQTIVDLNNRQLSHARQAVKGIQDHFRHYIDTLRMLSSQDHIIRMDEEGKKIMADIRNAYSSDIKGVTRMDSQGRIIYTVPYTAATIGMDISRQEHIRKAMRTRALVISDVFKAVQGYRSVAVHMPVFSQGAFVGTIAFLISFDALAKMYLEDIHIGKDGYAWVLSRDGIELYDPVPGVVGKSILEVGKEYPDLLALAGEMLKGKEGVTKYHFNQISGSEVGTILKHAVYMPISIGDTFWSIAVATPENEVTTLMEGFREKLLLMILILFIFCAVLTYFLIRALVVIREQEKRQSIEEALRQEHRKLQDIIEFFPDAVFVVDGDKKISAWNRAIEIMTGVEKEQMLGKGDYEYALPLFGSRRPILIDLLDMHSSEIEKTYKYVKREGQKIFAESYIPSLHQGRGAHLWGVAVPLYDGAGNRCGAIEAIRDVSEMKGQEETLQRTVRALRLLSQCNVAVIQAREERALLREICRIIVLTAGYSMAWVGYAEEGPAKLVRLVAQHGFEDGYLDSVTITYDETEFGRGPTGTAIRTGKPQRINNIMKDTAYGPWRVGAIKRGYASSIALPLNMDDLPFGALNIYANDPQAFHSEEVALLKELADNLTHGILALRARAERSEAINALERERAELEKRVIERTAELLQAKERAEAADKIKSAFLATMSHELRTLLNSIIGFTGIILQGLTGPLSEEQTKQLGMVRASARHLLELINDILDISKIEAGQLKISYEAFDLRKAIEKVIHIVTPLVDKKGLHLHFEIGEEISIIRGDQRRMEQAVMNLLTNAVKFTDHGDIYLKCSHDIETVILSVADSGIGIKAENIEAIFDPFHQVDIGISRVQEGTGLGLTITRKLVEMMGGTIYAQSEWGKGSTFTVSIPAAEGKIT